MSWQEVGARTSISLHPTSLDTCFSGVRAGLDLHSPVETCGSRGGGAAGSGGHCGEAVWRAEREGPTAMRLRPAAGERGGSQSPSTAVNYEGEEKIFKIYFCLGIFLPRRHTFFLFFAAVCVAAVISVAGADGELPGCNWAGPGQASARHHQTTSSRVTLGVSQPHLTQRVRVTPNATQTQHTVATQCKMWGQISSSLNSKGQKTFRCLMIAELIDRGADLLKRAK